MNWLSTRSKTTSDNVRSGELKKMTREYHILNLGCGVQSTTIYLMFLQGKLPIKLDCAIFADTQDEPAAVYRHLDWLQSLNGPPIMVRTRGRLSDHLKRGQNAHGGSFVAIPGFTVLPDRTGQMKRQCSMDYKVDVIERTIRREVLGLKAKARIPKDVLVTQYVGISLDEAGRFLRMQARRNLGKMRAPLIEMFMNRQQCKEWLAEFGHVPHEVPRSACVYCPFHTDEEWLRVKSVAEDWKLAVSVDEALRSGVVVQRNHDAEIFLHSSCKPLVEIEFHPKPKDERQISMPFYRECLGVCGV